MPLLFCFTSIPLPLYPLELSVCVSFNLKSFSYLVRITTPSAHTQPGHRHLPFHSIPSHPYNDEKMTPSHLRHHTPLPSSSPLFLKSKSSPSTSSLPSFLPCTLYSTLHYPTLFKTTPHNGILPHRRPRPLLRPPHPYVPHSASSPQLRDGTTGKVDRNADDACTRRRPFGLPQHRHDQVRCPGG